MTGFCSFASIFCKVICGRKCQILKGDVQIAETQLSTNETWCTIVNYIYMCRICAKRFVHLNVQKDLYIWMYKKICTFEFELSGCWQIIIFFMKLPQIWHSHKNGNFLFNIWKERNQPLLPYRPIDFVPENLLLFFTSCEPSRDQKKKKKKKKKSFSFSFRIPLVWQHNLCIWSYNCIKMWSKSMTLLFLEFISLETKTNVWNWIV